MAGGGVRDGRADETLCRHHSRFGEATGPGGECGRQRMVPRIIDFGPEAKAAWVAFYDLIEAAMAEDGSLECLRDVAGKAAENAARIAAILTIAEKPDATIIEVGAMTAGCELMAWYVAEALRLAGTHRLPLRTRNAIKLLDWLHSKGKAEIRIRELMQLAPRVEGFLWLPGWALAS